MRDCRHVSRVLYLVGGPPRVGKSALGRRMMERRRIPWLSTDVVRTVLRTLDRRIDELDRGHADPDLVAERMYPYLERMVDVALDQCGTVLVEGVEWFPRHLTRLNARLRDVPVRACFLGHVAYSHTDLASYQGVNRWHDGVQEEEAPRPARVDPSLERPAEDGVRGNRRGVYRRR